MRWTADQLPELTGRRIMITGANSGTGLAAANAFARRGADVTLAVRKTDAGEREAERIRADGARGTIAVESLDLADLSSVRSLGERWTEPLDVLVNNAGVMTPPRYREGADGMELQFQTNHLGHFALTALLLPRLLTGTRPRVTTMSSIVHKHGDARLTEPTPERGYDPTRAYGRSKLANLMFALELQRRADAAGLPLTSTAAHPGVTHTNLVASSDGLGGLPVVRTLAPFVQRVVMPSAARGAEALLFAATEAAPGTYTGPQQLFETRGPIGPALVSGLAVDPELARRLWQRSEELSGVPFEL